MKTFWKILKAILGIFVIAVIACAILGFPPASTGKLRGNQYTLHVCKWQISNWKNASAGNPSFDFYALSEADKKRTITWGLRPNFWIRTNFLWTGVSNRAVVIVCESEFDNVPKSSWSFGRKYPAHAVGYSDGKSGLVSPGEFTNLSMVGFVSLGNLLTNSEFNIAK